jgi:hypothetical protein
MDMEYGEMDDMMGYGEEQQYEMADGQYMEGEYDQEMEEDEESMNFDDHPEYAGLPKLDRMRKIRRQILRTINDIREAHGVPMMYPDTMGNKAATEYANYLMSNPEDENKAKEIAKEFHCVGEIVPLVGFAILEEDEDHQGTLQEQMMDAHGLLLELEYELSVLAQGEHTHVGIGFAFNKEQVKVVEFVSAKPLMINQVNQSEDGGVEARGVVLNKDVGLYAARLVALSKMSKDLKVVGPANIQF